MCLCERCRCPLQTQQYFTSQRYKHVPSLYSCKRTTFSFCRYQNIQRTMATEEDGGSQRLERSGSTETDSDSPPTGTALSLLTVYSDIISFSCQQTPEMSFAIVYFLMQYFVLAVISFKIFNIFIIDTHYAVPQSKPASVNCFRILRNNSLVVCLQAPPPLSITRRSAIFSNHLLSSSSHTQNSSLCYTVTM